MRDQQIYLPPKLESKFQEATEKCWQLIPYVYFKANGIEFILDDQLAIKRLRFADNIQEKADSYEAQDSDEQFAIEFSVMTLELSSFIKHLIDALGGINTEQQSVEEIVARVDNASISGSDTGVKDVSFE